MATEFYNQTEVEKAFAEWAVTDAGGPILWNNANIDLRPTGKALKRIRDGRLYREQFNNFYVYCARRWGLMPNRVDYLIDLGEQEAPVHTPVLQDRPKPKQSCVYFMLAGDFVKIGTTTDLKRRLTALQLASPIELKVIATLPGDSKKEAELHKRFSAYRKHGEWFVFSSEIKLFVEALSK